MQSGTGARVVIYPKGDALAYRWLVEYHQLMATPPDARPELTEWYTRDMSDLAVAGTVFGPIFLGLGIVGAEIGMGAVSAIPTIAGTLLIREAVVDVIDLRSQYRASRDTAPSETEPTPEV